MPLGTVQEDVENRHCQVVVGVHQAQAARNNAMPVVINIVAKGDIEFVLHRDQICHSIRAGAIHADFAVVIESHERECRVDALVDDL